MHEMLEEADRNQIEHVSPFFGDIEDVCCRITTNSPVTELFTLYIDIVKKMFNRNGEPDWAEQELSDLQGQNKTFREKAK